MGRVRGRAAEEELTEGRVGRGEGSGGGERKGKGGKGVEGGRRRRWKGGGAPALTRGGFRARGGRLPRPRVVPAACCLVWSEDAAVPGAPPDAAATHTRAWRARAPTLAPPGARALDLPRLPKCRTSRVPTGQDSAIPRFWGPEKPECCVLRSLQVFGDTRGLEFRVAETTSEILESWGSHAACPGVKKA